MKIINLVITLIIGITSAGYCLPSIDIIDTTVVLQPGTDTCINYIITGSGYGDTQLFWDTADFPAFAHTGTPDTRFCIIGDTYGIAEFTLKLCLTDSTFVFDTEIIKLAVAARPEVRITSPDTILVKGSNYVLTAVITDSDADGEDTFSWKEEGPDRLNLSYDSIYIKSFNYKFDTSGLYFLSFQSSDSWFSSNVDTVSVRVVDTYMVLQDTVFTYNKIPGEISKIAVGIQETVETTYIEIPLTDNNTGTWVISLLPAINNGYFLINNIEQALYDKKISKYRSEEFYLNIGTVQGFKFCSVNGLDSADTKLLTNAVVTYIFNNQSGDSNYICKFSEEDSIWIPLYPTVKTQDNKSLYFDTEYFSVYSVGTVLFDTPANDLADVVIYPNPYRVNDGNNFTGTEYTSSSGGIYFIHLPPGTSIEVYTIRGEKIVNLFSETGGKLRWDSINQYGEKVVSGVYLSLIKNAGSKIIRKIVIIR